MELTAEQCRIVGCLIEERATPQNYPLTLNSLRLACNQSTNRDPIVDYDDHLVESTLTSLREQGLTRIVYSTSNRAAKYRHVLDEVLRLEGDEISVLCVLLVRGPQTPRELRDRTERLHGFGDLGAVQETLDRLASRDEPLVLRLERRPGQRDERYIHLLGDDDVTADLEGGHHERDVPRGEHRYATSYEPRHDAGDDRDDRFDGRADERYEAQPTSPASSSSSSSSSSSTPAGPTTEDLQLEIDALRDELAELRAQFDVFRSQFD